MIRNWYNQIPYPALKPNQNDKAVQPETHYIETIRKKYWGFNPVIFSDPLYWNDQTTQ